MSKTTVVAAGNIKATDAEVIEMFPQLVEAGKPFINAISDPKKSDKDGKTYFQLYVIQKKVYTNTEFNDLDTLFQGWTGSRVTLERTIRNVDLEHVANSNFLSEISKVGAVLDGMAIERTFKDTPAYATQTPVRIANNTGGFDLLINADTKKPVYKHTRLVVEDQLNDMPSNFLRVSEEDFKQIENNKSSAHALLMDSEEVGG